MKEYPLSFDNRNFIIQVGQNAKENWELIDGADDFDLWFHLDSGPSAHVIIKEILNKKNHFVINNDFFGYPRELITMGSTYCKSNSRCPTSKVSIIYTTIENISKGKDIGSVIVKTSKCIIL
jgi:predicted ribosome quality control (RQC) complex YloA/Tae2 family protein